MFKQHLKLSSSIGVSIQINANNTLDIQTCILTRNKNHLDFEKKVIGLKSLEDLADYVHLHSIIALNLHGKGILHKQIERVSDINAHHFSQIFPGANLKDFYVQNFVSGGKSFVSIIRRSEADHWIQQCLNLGFIPVMLSMGPYPVQLILPQLNVYGESLVFDGHTITRNTDGEWESYHYNPDLHAPFPFKIENEPIDEQLLISYAVAFQLLFAHFSETIEAKVPSLISGFNSLITKKKTRIYSFVLAGSFLSIFIINSIICSSIKKSNQELEAQVSQSFKGRKEYREVESQIRKKEQQLQVLGWDGGLNKAYIIDQISALLPQEVSLSEISINPIDLNNSRNQQKIIFLERKILISGYSERIVPVNDWILEIKEKKLVHNIQLQSYTYNPEVKKGQFVVVLSY